MDMVSQPVLSLEEKQLHLTRLKHIIINILTYLRLTNIFKHNFFGTELTIKVNVKKER